MSTTNPVRTALASLLDSPADRSKMARFRDIAADVDKLVRAGVRRPAIIKTLAAHGLELTPAQLKSYLERWRAAQSRSPEAEPTPEPGHLPTPPAQSVGGSGRQATTASPPLADELPPPRSGRSIREIRNAEVDFAAADKWYREQRKAGKG